MLTPRPSDTAHCARLVTRSLVRSGRHPGYSGRRSIFVFRVVHIAFPQRESLTRPTANRRCTSRTQQPHHTQDPALATCRRRTRGAGDQLGRLCFPGHGRRQHRGDPTGRLPVTSAIGLFGRRLGAASSAASNSLVARRSGLIDPGAHERLLAPRVGPGAARRHRQPGSCSSALGAARGSPSWRSAGCLALGHPRDLPPEGMLFKCRFAQDDEQGVYGPAVGPSSSESSASSSSHRCYRDTLDPAAR